MCSARSFQGFLRVCRLRTVTRRAVTRRFGAVARLDSAGLRQTRPDSAGLRQTRPDTAGLRRTRPDTAGLRQNEEHVNSVISPEGPTVMARRWLQLLVGLFLYGIAIAMMVQAGIGVSPWANRA